MSELGYGLDEYEIWYEFYGPGSKEDCEVHNLDEFDDIFYNEDEDIYEVNRCDEDGKEIFEEYILSDVNENELTLLNRYIKNEDGEWEEEDDEEYRDNYVL